MRAAGSVLQHGKDFEAIQNNIALKYRKKGRPAGMVKNKEQVRHFYYRTWHKITKYIDFDNGERRLPPRAGPVPAQRTTRRVLGSARLLAGGLVAGSWAELRGRLWRLGAWLTCWEGGYHGSGSYLFIPRPSPQGALVG